MALALFPVNGSALFETNLHVGSSPHVHGSTNTSERGCTGYCSEYGCTEIVTTLPSNVTCWRTQRSWPSTVMFFVRAVGWRRGGWSSEHAGHAVNGPGGSFVELLLEAARAGDGAYW